MSRLRDESRAALHHTFAKGCTNWTPTPFSSPYLVYVERHGVSHLLANDMHDETIERLLDLDFLAAYLKSWPTIEHPLAAWRTVGLDNAHTGYATLGRQLRDLGRHCDLYAPTTVILALEFLCRAALFPSALDLAEWLSLATQTQGDSPSELHLRVTGLLAEVFTGLGRYPEADRHYRQALDGLTVEEGGYGPFSLDLALKYSFMLADWGDNLSKAGELMAEVTHALRQANRSSLDLAGALIELGYIYARTGRRSDAENLFNESLELVEPHYGKRHSTVLRAKHLLAWTWRCERRYPEATKLFLEVLALRKATLGEQHPDTAMIFGNLAGIHTATGDYEAALTFNRLAEKGESRLGASNVYTFIRRQREGLILREMGKLHDAADIFLSVWQDSQEHLGETNAISVQTGCMLARVFATLGKHDEAVQIYHGILALKPTSSGAGVFPYSSIHHAVAQSLNELQRPAEAADHHRQCWQIDANDNGPAASRTLHMAHALAEDLFAAGQNKQALGVVQEALAAARTADDDDDDRATWVTKLEALHGQNA